MHTGMRIGFNLFTAVYMCGCSDADVGERASAP
eukprot:SAG31_NODE_35800_length_319_cov_1.654545_1_plen_32_part_10